MNYERKNNIGFTLIEVIVAMAIMTVLVGLGLFISMDFYRSYAFHSEEGLALSVFQKARNLALNNVNESSHGVYLGSSEYVLFQGPSYADRDVTYDQTVQIAGPITHTGLSEVVFAPLTGETTAGSVILSGGGKTASLSFNNEGRINW